MISIAFLILGAGLLYTLLEVVADFVRSGDSNLAALATLLFAIGFVLLLLALFVRLIWNSVRSSSIAAPALRDRP
jgi:cytochrome b561